MAEQYLVSVRYYSESHGLLLWVRNVTFAYEYQAVSFANRILNVRTSHWASDRTPGVNTHFRVTGERDRLITAMALKPTNITVRYKGELISWRNI